MSVPFPGMDPYLEHPVLWEGFHARLIPEMADQLQPRLDPRYIATVEERVFVEGPQRRIPDVWVEKRIEILDLHNQQRLVAVIELLSPTNKPRVQEGSPTSKNSRRFWNGTAI
jgi:hypothetical protein